MSAVTLHPYHLVSAAEVFRDLDPCDQTEADVALGYRIAPDAMAQLWSDLAIHTLYQAVAAWQGQAFAVFSLSSAGMAGNASAALMARDHRRFRRPLAELALRIRAEMPGFALGLGVNRIEARSWAPHPTAGRLLSALGFAQECDLPGLGADGRHTFRQWAWLAPHCRPAPLTAASPLSEKETLPCA